ncbi:MAG: bifunctional serine/threonine-protein kinase/formylglycine-generating enzyme family protein [Planctomycetota bacterium]
MPLPALLAAHPAAAAMLLEALLTQQLDVPEPPRPTSPAPGERRIGPFAVERELGRGGQAVVYCTTDTRLGRRVALKVLPPGAFHSAQAVQRFRAEAATTSRLDHPGICQVYEVGEVEDLMYLAMRYVDGETLAARIERSARATPAGAPLDLQLGAAVEGGSDTGRRSRPWVPTLRLFESCLLALDAAHRAGVAHRDFKPANVMVQPDGAPVVLDFGLAADTARVDASLTRSGDVFGTPAYMAPEQCRNARDADWCSDLFAVGAALFEALTGQRAFAAATAEATIRKILGGVVPNPCRVVRSLPRELAIVVGKALDPDPARRYASAAAFAADLQRIRELRPIQAVPPSAPLRLRRFLQRNRLPSALAATVVVASAVSASTWWRAADAAATVEQLAQPRQLADLVAAQPGLLPIADHRAAAEAWARRARDLVETRPLLVERLAAIRARALPPSPGDDPELERLLAADREALTRLDEREAAIVAGNGTAEALADLRQPAAAAARAARRQALAHRLATTRTWRFAGTADRTLHDSTARLLADVDAFAGDDGPLQQVERELAAIAAQGAVSWDEAVTAVANQPAYRGLVLRPQTGLVPLRQDPHSGLYEFLHLRSGKRPPIDADGRLRPDDDSGVVLVLLPGGTVQLGATRDATQPLFDADSEANEQYTGTFELRPFFVSKFELTQAQWQRLSNGSRPSLWSPSGTHPVENIAFDQARDVLAPSGLWLPTEAQWEYAARGGTTGPRWCGSAIADLQGAENLFDAAADADPNLRMNGIVLPWDDGFAYHAPVGSFRPNPFGLHDALGNVKEWCLDPESYPDRDVHRQGDGMWLGTRDKHVLRGGCFGHDAKWARATSRSITGEGDWFFGVRPVRRVE